MFNLSVPDFLLTMATALVILGLISICIGIFVLVSRTVGKDIKNLADQTTKLAQKGIAEDVSGLVGNASSLMAAMNDLIKTSSGIGVFLVFVGILLMAGAYWLVIQISALV
jgi:hypothetical protein